MAERIRFAAASTWRKVAFGRRRQVTRTSRAWGNERSRVGVVPQVKQRRARTEQVEDLGALDADQPEHRERFHEAPDGVCPGRAPDGLHHARSGERRRALQARPRLWPGEGGNGGKHEHRLPASARPEDARRLRRPGQRGIVVLVRKQQEQRAPGRLLQAAEEVFAGGQDFAGQRDGIQRSGGFGGSGAEGDHGAHRLHTGMGNTGGGAPKAPLNTCRTPRRTSCPASPRAPSAATAAGDGNVRPARW